MNIQATFSGFSVDDLEAAKQFYIETLGCKAQDQMGGAELTLPGGAKIWMYVKPDHTPASYTMLNIVVADIDTAVDELTSRGVVFEHYEGMQQDEKGIARGKQHNRGPDIAWFKDPAGNILAIIED